jgi:hypothetical protein
MPLSLPSNFTFPPSANQWGGGATALTSRGPHYFYVSLDVSKAPNVPGVVMETIYGRGFVDALAFNNKACWSAPAPVLTPPLMSVSRKDGDGNPISAPSGLFAIDDRADGIFLIWTDASGNVWGSHSEKAGVWGPRFQFAGVTVPIPDGAGRTYGVSAYWSSDNLVLVWWGGNGTGLMATSFPAANLQPSSSSASGAAWASASSVKIGLLSSPVPANPCVSVVAVAMPCKDNGSGGFVAPASQADTTSFQQVTFISLSDTTTTTPIVIWCVFVDTLSGLPSLNPYQNFAAMENATVGTFTIDPSGVVYLYWQGTANSNLVRTQFTDQASGMVLSSVLNATLTCPGSAAPPSIAYVIGRESRASIGATLTDGTATSLPSVSAQAYLSVFLLGGVTGADPGSGILYFEHYATLHRVASNINLAYIGSDGQTLPAIVAKGIIDGPIPVPGQNLVVYNEEGTAGTIAPWDFFKPIARIVYGENSARDITHLVAVSGEVVKSHEVNVLGGYQAELSGSLGVNLGKDGRVGVGVSYPLISASFLGGTEKQWSSGKEHDATLSMGIATVNEANVVGLTTRVLPPPSGATNPVLNQQGFVFGSTLSIVPVALYSLPPDATALSGRPTMVTFFPRSVMHVGAHYNANYAFTPGDLTTYSVESINGKMAAVYSDWTKKNPGASDPFGTAYSNNYFKNVVEKHALRIGPGGKNYLEFSVANDGMSETRFDLSQERFREWAVTVSKSTYKASVDSDGAAILGGGATVDRKNGKEVTFTANTTQRLEQSDQWGISVAIDGFPQATMPGQGQVCGYTFRLYFLPSNPLWVQELLCFSDYNNTATNPANAGRPLDPGAAPWKIMFVVEQDSIVTLT